MMRPLLTSPAIAPKFGGFLHVLTLELCGPHRRDLMVADASAYGYGCRGRWSWGGQGVGREDGAGRRRGAWGVRGCLDGKRCGLGRCTFEEAGSSSLRSLSPSAPHSSPPSHHPSLTASLGNNMLNTMAQILAEAAGEAVGRACGPRRLGTRGKLFCHEDRTLWMVCAGFMYPSLGLSRRPRPWHRNRC